MSTRWTLAASAAVAALAVAGCASSPPEYNPAPGTLVAGTAQITVNGNDLGLTDTVQCDPAGTLLMMTTRASDDPEAPGITAMIASADELVVRQVGIHDLGGFTGSYNEGLGGEATVSMTGRTYDISGTADGFDTDNPSFRTTGNFQIKIAC